jgi:MFS family permease
MLRPVDLEGGGVQDRKAPMAAPYYGWYVVAASATIACFSWGFAFYGLGVHLHVLVRVHVWPTGAISVAVTACYLIGALLIIAAGRLIDRHGPRGCSPTVSARWRARSLCSGRSLPAG